MITAVMRAAWHDAAAGFLHNHDKPGFWLACFLITVAGLAMARELS